MKCVYIAGIKNNTRATVAVADWRGQRNIYRHPEEGHP